MHDNGGGSKAERKKSPKIVRFPTRFLNWDMWASNRGLAWKLEKKGLLLDVVSYCWYNQQRPDWANLAKQIRCNPRTIRAHVDDDFKSVVTDLLKQRIPLDDVMRAEVYDRARGLCTYCKKPLGVGWHVDLVVPVAAAGMSQSYNLVAACAPCNMRKGART